MSSKELTPMKSATSSLASSLNLEVEKPEQSSTIGMVVDENPSGGPGLSVVQIDPDSLATKSGLVLGDVVLSVNGDALTSPEQAGVLLSEGVGALMLEVVREKASAKGQVGTAEEKTGGGAAEAAEAAAAEEKARKPSLGIKNEESGPDVYEVPVPPGLKPGRKFQMLTETGEKILVEVPPGFEPGQVMQVKVPKPVGAPMQQSVPAAPPAGVQVQIPPGVGPGQQFTAQMPDGQQMAVTVPDGCQAGQVIQVQAPMAMAVAPPPSGIPTAGVNTVNNTVTNVTNVTNITTVKGEGDWFAEGEVTPWCAWCCGYSACIPSCAVTDTCAFLCCNCFTGCCQRGSEGCVLCSHKDWLTCTGITCCKNAGNCFCFASVCAFPCQKDIPCRLTICWCTLCGSGGCGCCKKADFGKALMGKTGAPPTALAMER